jgi:hypothetical protein
MQVNFRYQTRRSLKLGSVQPYDLSIDETASRLRHSVLYKHGLEALSGAWGGGCLTPRRTGGP